MSAKLILGVLLFAIASHAVPTNAKAALSEASAVGQFLFLTFYQTKDASFTSLSSTVAAVKKSSTKKIAIFNAAISDPANKETVEKYGIQAPQLPLLLVIAPNGVVTGGHPSNVTADQLKQSVSISDLMLKVLKPLQEQKVALVALQNTSTKFNAESWAGVNEFANDAQYKNLVAAVKADPAAAGSQEFVKQCQLIAPLTQATVVVLLPPGRIGKVLSGKVTKADILTSLQACAAGSSCKPGACSDRRFKQNITPIDSALEKVAKLQGVTYTWDKTNFPRRFFPDGSEVGLIAQDVESVIPEVVQTDAEGYKSITYDKLTAVLIEAVKEMKQKIDSQDSLIQTQNARLKALEGN
jgi:hypothetical protein